MINRHLDESCIREILREESLMTKAELGVSILEEAALESKNTIPSTPSKINNPTEDSDQGNFDKNEVTLKGFKPLLLSIIKFEVAGFPSKKPEKATLRIIHAKEIIQLEINQNKNDLNELRFRLEFKYSDITSIGIIRKDESVIIYYKEVLCFSEILKKKTNSWKTVSIEEVFQTKRETQDQPLNDLLLSFSHESFLKLLSNKTRVLERFREQNINMKELSKIPSRKKVNDKTQLPIKEIHSTEELIELKKRETNLKTLDISKKLDAIKLVGLPNISEYSGKTRNCPIYSCSQTFSSINMLKAHIYGDHPELKENGVDIDSSGTISYPSSTVDFILMTLKMFPQLITSEVLDLGRELEDKIKNK